MAFGHRINAALLAQALALGHRFLAQRRHHFRDHLAARCRVVAQPQLDQRVGQPHDAQPQAAQVLRGDPVVFQCEHVHVQHVVEKAHAGAHVSPEASEIELTVLHVGGQVDRAEIAGLADSEGDLATGIGAANLIALAQVPQRRVLVDPVHENQPRFAGTPGVLRHLIPQPGRRNAAVLTSVIDWYAFCAVFLALRQVRPVAAEVACLLGQVILARHLLGRQGPDAARLQGVPERLVHQNRDVEGGDVALAGFAVEVLGGQEIQHIGVRDADGGHPRAASRSALPHHPQHRRIDIPQGIDRPALFGPPVGPLQKVVENLHQEADRPAAGAARPPDGRALGPHP